jgi:hypothetical protein
MLRGNLGSEGKNMGKGGRLLNESPGKQSVPTDIGCDMNREVYGRKIMMTSKSQSKYFHFLLKTATGESTTFLVCLPASIARSPGLSHPRNNAKLI